jgi:ferric-dicitrate binding protein FerR (iron transport regulator)
MQQRELVPGQAVSYAAREPALRQRAADPIVRTKPVTSTAIREYTDVRVGTLIAEVNLTARRPIRLDSPRLADRRVSGRFRTDDSVRLASHLATLFELDIDTSDPSTIVLRSQ